MREATVAALATAVALMLQRPWGADGDANTTLASDMEEDVVELAASNRFPVVSGAKSGEQRSGRKSYSSYEVNTPGEDELLSKLYKYHVDEKKDFDPEKDGSSKDDDDDDDAGEKRRKKRKKKKRRKKERRKKPHENSEEDADAGDEDVSNLETANSDPIDLKEMGEMNSSADSPEDVTASTPPSAREKRRRKKKKKKKQKEKGSDDMAQALAEDIKQQFSNLQAEFRGDTANHDNSLDDQDEAKATTDQLEAASGHQKGHHSEKEKGGGHKHAKEAHKKKGKKKKKGYKEKHSYKKKTKGHHDKAAHKKKYKDEKGKKLKHEEGASHFGEHKSSEKGKKGAKYDEEGHHKKGHHTKGEHNVHKKDEYHKKHEFYDEHHEGGGHHKSHGHHHHHHKGHGAKHKKGLHAGTMKHGYKDKMGHLDHHGGHSEQRAKIAKYHGKKKKKYRGQALTGKAGTVGQHHGGHWHPKMAKYSKYRSKH